MQSFEFLIINIDGRHAVGLRFLLMGRSSCRRVDPSQTLARSSTACWFQRACDS